MSALPTREDDRTMGALRKRVPFLARRKVKRQSPAPIRVEARDDDGVESGDEPPSPASPTTSSAFILPTPPQQTVELQPTIQPPPPQSTIPPPSPTSSTTTSSSTSAPRVLPIQVPQTSQTTSTTTSRSPSPTTLLTSQSPSTSIPTLSSTTRQPVRLVSSIPGTSSTTSTGRLLGPTPEAIESEVVLPSGKTRAHTTLSHDATIALEVVGIVTGVGILLGIAWFFFRPVKRRRQQRVKGLLDPPSSPTPTNSPTQYSSSSSKSIPTIIGRFFKVHALLGESSKTPGIADEKRFPNWNGNGVGNASADFNDSVAGRKQRLRLVKEDLLSEKDDFRQSEFLRTPRAPFTNDPADRRMSESEESRALKLELGGGSRENGMEVPRKAFMKRNTSGKLVMRGVMPGGNGGGSVTKLKGLGLSFGGAFSGRGKEEDEESLVVDANRVEVDRRAPGARNPFTGFTNSLRLKVGNTDPTMMSGGLRVSGRGVGNEGLVPPTNSKEQSIQGSSAGESGVLGRDGVKGYRSGASSLRGQKNPEAWKNLEGLRRGDPYVERGVDRQSFVSGWQDSSRTSWGTNVWERLERERELREGRERMEGGLGGMVPNNRESSVAKWRDPVSWIKDQAERRDDIAKR